MTVQRGGDDGSDDGDSNRDPSGCQPPGSCVTRSLWKVAQVSVTARPPPTRTVWLLHLAFYFSLSRTLPEAVLVLGDHSPPLLRRS